MSQWKLVLALLNKRFLLHIFFCTCVKMDNFCPCFYLRLALFLSLFNFLSMYDLYFLSPWICTDFVWKGRKLKIIVLNFTKGWNFHISVWKSFNTIFLLQKKLTFRAQIFSTAKRTKFFFLIFKETITFIIF